MCKGYSKNMGEFVQCYTGGYQPVEEGRHQAKAKEATQCDDGQGMPAEEGTHQAKQMCKEFSDVTPNKRCHQRKAEGCRGVSLVRLQTRNVNRRRQMRSKSRGSGPMQHQRNKANNGRHIPNKCTEISPIKHWKRDASKGR